MTAPSYVHAEGGIGAVFSYGADSFLSRGSSGATLRSVTIGLAILIYWSGLSWALAPSPSVVPSWVAGLPFPADALARVVAALFAPAVLTHLIPVIGGTWLAYRLASHYLADLFELESFGLSARYLRGAVWGLGYDTLAVSSGDLNQLDWTSPMVRVGGPGLLAIHLGFAAVFETAEGHPRVYGPAPRRFVLGFERLRDVVDLRDQMRPVEEVRSTTRDGVEVCAHDVQMMFRVYGGGQPRGLSDPYPFTEESVRRLVYAQMIGDHGLERWTDALPDLIRSEISGFVSGLTLEEFLALQPASNDARPSSPATFHIPRRRLTEQLHTDELRQRLQQAGLELAWVGVGTWEIAQAGRSTDSSRAQTLSSVWRDVQRMHRLDQQLDTDMSAGAQSKGEAELVLQSLAEAWETAAARGSDPKAALLERIRSVLLDQRQEPEDWPAGAQARPLDAIHEHLAALQSSIGVGGAMP